MAKSLKKSKSTISEIRKESGVLHYTNGDTYDGEYFVNIKKKLLERNGNGSYTTWDGQTYTGHWLKDKLTDETDIELKYPDGSSFVGALTPELQYLKGTYIFSNESKLTGNFKKNTPILSADTKFIDKDNKKWDLKFDKNHENELVLKPIKNFFDYDPNAEESSSSSSSEDEDGGDGGVAEEKEDIETKKENL